jgi:hypothetical protein
MSSVKVASPPRALFDFPFSERFSVAEPQTRSNELFFAFFWFWSSLFARLCSCSALSIVGLGYSAAFDSALHSRFYDFLCLFHPF